MPEDRPLLASDRQTHTAAVCARCGCLCDDLVLADNHGRLHWPDARCALGQSWLESRGEPQVRAYVDGQEVTTDVALAQAQRLLQQAHAPAIQGLYGATNEALAAAFRLASALEAWLVPWPAWPASFERSGFETPEFTASLSAVRGTADLVIYWLADPRPTHPRHLERLADDAGLRRCDRRRRLIVTPPDAPGFAAAPTNPTVDIRPLASSDGLGSGVVRRLHQALRVGLAGEQAAACPATDDPSQNAANLLVDCLADALRSARHAHVFLADAAARDFELPLAWNALAADLRQRLHVTVSSLAPAGNERGVWEILTALTGGPGPWCPPARRAGDAMSRLRQGGWLPDLVEDPLAPNPSASDCCLWLCPTLSDEPRPGSRLARALTQGAPRQIVIDCHPAQRADVCFVVPGLDPRLAASVTRCDGQILTLHGPGAAGPPDPTVALLEHLLAAAEPAASVARFPSRGSTRP